MRIHLLILEQNVFTIKLLINIYFLQIRLYFIKSFVVRIFFAFSVCTYPRKKKEHLTIMKMNSRKFKVSDT